MSKSIHLFTLLLFLLSISITPRLLAKSTETTIVVDDEYDRYKKRGDEFFKEGKYLEARRQYQNCLEVPGFENDKYAKEQIDECNMGLNLRRKVEEAIQKGNKAQTVDLLSQLLNLNPDDALTRTQFADYYEREGNQLFNQKRYVDAKNSYAEAVNYASATKRETLTIQIRTIDDLMKPVYPKRVGLKVATGLVAVGAGAYAYLLWHDHQTKMDVLNQISKSADPSNTGVIDNPTTYSQYNDAYNAVEAANKKNSGLFKACVGIAAVATVAEAYLLIHKPKPRQQGLSWHPSSQSWGLAIRYTF